MSHGKVLTDNGKTHLQDWEKMEPILKKYSNKRDLTIHVSNPHGEISIVHEYDLKNLWIKFWSVPEMSTSRITIMENACGYNLERGRSADAFNPTGNGIPIIDKNNIILAEIINKNNIFVLFDLPHRFEYSDKVLEFILNEYDILCHKKAIVRCFWHIFYQCSNTYKLFKKMVSKKKGFKIIGKIKIPLSIPRFGQRKLYIETFMDPKTKLLYRDKKEINERWKNLVKIANKQVYVINKNILVPLGKGISPNSQLRCFHITICLDTKEMEVFSIMSRKPFSVGRFRQYKYEKKHHCLGNISSGVREFLEPEIRQDSLTVLAMKEYFRQGNY